MAGIVSATFNEMSPSNDGQPVSVLEVETQWSLITGWTGFCGTNAVPYQNLADYVSTYSTVTTKHGR